MSALPEGVTFHKGRFLVQVELTPDPVTGKRRRQQFTAPRCKAHGRGATERSCRACQHAARDLRAAKLVELKSQVPTASSQMNLHQWFELWLEAHAGKVRSSTLSGYRKKIRTIIAPRLGDMKVQSLTATQLEAFYTRLMEGDELHPRGYALATVRQVHAILRRSLRDATMPRGTLLAHNPASQLELPSDDDGEIRPLRVWTIEQLRTFLAASRGHRLETLFYLAAATGMRRSELAGLRWDMVDLDRGLVRVERTRHYVEGEEVWSRPKSRRSRRVIELSDQQSQVVRTHRRTQAELRLKAGSAWADNDLVFCDEVGRGERPDGWSAEFRRVVGRLDVPPIRFHDLRHTHATLLLEQGRPIKEVSERLGHSSTAFTMDVYSHVTGTMRSVTADVLDQILGG